MSVILCRKEQVSHPYFIDILGVHVYTSQELCYAIYHHPLLFMDGFMDQSLVEFIRDELKMGFVALKMERWMKSRENPDELIFLFLQESNYYTTAEINNLRQKVVALRKLPPVEYAKKKADYLFEFKQYGKAIEGYEKILESAGAFRANQQFLGRVWNNLGACYARVLQLKKAMDAFGQAYGKLKDLEILKKIYYLTVLYPELELAEGYRSHVTDERKAAWDAELKKVQKKAEASRGQKKLKKMFDKDPVKRMESAAKLVETWKQEYRGMA